MISCYTAVFVSQGYNKIVALEPPARFQVPIAFGQNTLLLEEEVKVGVIIIILL